MFVVNYEVVASTDLWVLLTSVAVTSTKPYYSCKWEGTLWDNGASTFQVILEKGVSGCKIRKIDNIYNQCNRLFGINPPNPPIDY